MRRLLALAAAGLLLSLGGCLRYSPPPPPQTTDVDAWVAAKVAAAEADGVRPGDEERLLRQAEGKTPLAILYIHGYGASRQNGEAVVEPLAEALGANTYELRLPGHGVDDPEYLHAAEWSDYIDVAEEAFAMTRLLGDEVVVMGSSTGGLLATWLAAQHSDEVKALVVGSPFYAFADPTSVILRLPGKRLALRLVVGKYRDAGWNPPEGPDGRVHPDYPKHWTTTQRAATLITLEKLRGFIAKEETYARVEAPTLMFAHYKDEETQDTVAQVAAMREAFAQLGQDTAPSPLNRFVEIADGNHILMSAYVRTDKARIHAELESFFAALGHPVDL